MRVPGSLLILLILLTLNQSGCGPDRPETVPPELRAAIDSFYAAVEHGDVEARIALFAEDALMLPNHWTLIRGKAVSYTHLTLPTN